ncbi:MAG: hypothetical protein FWC27_11905 [Firmicutes bacterium]|nr:hypothetical protein [Bacillota bacterium]
MNQLRRILFRVLKAYRDNSWLKLLISLGFAILISFLWIIALPRSSSYLSDISINIIASVLYAALLLRFLEAILSAALHWLEDPLKLTTNYNWLCKYYAKLNNSFVKWTNSAPSALLAFGEKRTNCEKQSDGSYLFPVQLLYLNDKQHIFQLTDCQDVYHLPSLVEHNYPALFRAHQFSSVYDNTMIRLRDCHVENGKVVLETERTTYFRSLVTNRSMDFEFAEGLSLRRIHDFGVGSAILSASQLSNHLGFHCIIETTDGMIAFVKRSRFVSIGKWMLGIGVEASLKTKYALNQDGSLEIHGIVRAVEGEVKDELGLSTSDFVAPTLEQNLIAIYREFVEGGKPQLLWYIPLTISSEDLREKFNVQRKSGVKNLQDGPEIVFLSKADLHRSYISPDGICVSSGTGNKRYQMVPSSSASIVMYLQWANSLPTP